MKTALRWLLTVFMVGAGANHFIVPGTYAAMIPDALPADHLPASTGHLDIFVRPSADKFWKEFLLKKLCR